MTGFRSDDTGKTQPMTHDSNAVPAMSRRSFTAATAATLSTTMVHSSLAATEETRELRLGIVGCGGRGSGAINDSLSINSGVRLVAAADLYAPKCESLWKRMREAHPDKFAAQGAAAQRLAQRWSCVVVLKGAGTVMAAPNEVPAINPTGNPRLACAGTGDVLAGLVGAAMARGLAAWPAAHLAVFQHGLAADHWPEDQALTAEALARTVGL